jgi:hypothetical protein
MILIALADVKACFWYARIHADLTGGFGFLADDPYNLAAMAFDSTASASSLESFLVGHQGSYQSFSNRPDLVIKHKKYLDILKWEKMDHSMKKVCAFPCAIYWGIIDGAWKQINLPACIYIYTMH